ncbi:hypothetical protein COCNU_01G017010 [Cocos nucifera]|uniref:Uncharacterized protein n=1 Tax=Cocos nucifera TaxID=13894 RepID=A0A8K0HW75_COCNU|nr:hypothetical protein COCNU_01G017010 [Cocos nucifera]
MAFLKLGYYLCAHSEAVNLHKVEASKTIQEAQEEIKKVQAKVEDPKKASRSHSAKVDHLQEALRREEQVSVGLKAALSLEEEKQRKAKEEVDAEKERAVEVFKSTKVMEDIKIAFTQEAFLEGFMVCMKRIVKKFPNTDLDFLIEEPGDKVEPSHIDAVPPIIRPDAETSNTAMVISESVPEPGVAEDMPTSPTAPPPEDENL